MHKCVRCSTIYQNNAKELLSGCPCGARVFVFIREGKEGKPAEELADEDYSWLEAEFKSLAKSKPVSVDADSAENLRILEKGAYELDVKSLMGGNPLVVKSEKGIYYIKVPHLQK